MAGFFKIDNSEREAMVRTLDVYERDLYAHICYRGGTCWESSRHIAETLGIAKNTVLRALSGLESKGWVTVERVTGVRWSIRRTGPGVGPVTSADRSNRRTRVVHEAHQGGPGDGPEVVQEMDLNKTTEQDSENKTHRTRSRARGKGSGDDLRLSDLKAMGRAMGIIDAQVERLKAERDYQPRGLTPPPAWEHVASEALAELSAEDVGRILEWAALCEDSPYYAHAILGNPVAPLENKHALKWDGYLAAWRKWQGKVTPKEIVYSTTTDGGFDQV